MDHLLSIVLWTPLVGVLVLLLIPSSNSRAIKLWANVASFAGFLVCLPLVFQYDRTADWQFVERADWIPAIGASYHLGIDGFSLLLVVHDRRCWGSSRSSAVGTRSTTRLKEYYAHFLLLQIGMMGVFMALDFLLFFVFWELVLVPMYFIIAIWGGPRRMYSAIKFVIYTLVGSVLMLLGILTLYYRALPASSASPSFDITDCCSSNSGPACSGGSSGRFSSASPSRCRCSRSTPGCRTPTPKRRRPARSSWPPSC